MGISKEFVDNLDVSFKIVSYHRPAVGWFIHGGYLGDIVEIFGGYFGILALNLFLRCSSRKTALENTEINVITSIQQPCPLTFLPGAATQHLYRHK